MIRMVRGGRTGRRRRRMGRRRIWRRRGRKKEEEDDEARRTDRLRVVRGWQSQKPRICFGGARIKYQVWE